MHKFPRISVVTCSYNQGEFIGRTIDSVLAQNYPNVEHIVVDGMSRDNTVHVLSQYPHLRVIRESDHGQADAINKGFRAATGDIFCFLNSDDTYEPGALHRAAAEIDPAQGRHVVMGRCRFIDEEDNDLGIEHPSMFVNHRRVLEIWKGHCIPQPAVFWTREVWERCGPLDENEQLVLDYDLFCRFSKRYHFHWIDQMFANYRLHSESKTVSRGDKQMMAEALRVSRRYWGSPLTPQYWKLRFSFWRSQLQCRKRALAFLRKGRQLRANRDWFLAAIQDVLGMASAPDLYLDAILLPAVQKRFPGLFRWLGRLSPLCDPRGRYFQTLVWRGFDGIHVDGWVGPRFAANVEVIPGQTHLRVDGRAIETDVRHLPESLTITAYLDDRELGCQMAGRGEFRIEFPLGEIRPGSHRLRLESNTYLVSHAYNDNEDYRPLSFRLHDLRLASRFEKLPVAQRSAA